MRLRMHFNLTAAISTIPLLKYLYYKFLRYSKLEIIINKKDIMITFIAFLR
jgi:hypothetical protein